MDQKSKPLIENAFWIQFKTLVGAFSEGEKNIAPAWHRMIMQSLRWLSGNDGTRIDFRWFRSTLALAWRRSLSKNVQSQVNENVNKGWKQVAKISENKSRPWHWSLNYPSCQRSLTVTDRARGCMILCLGISPSVRPYAQPQKDARSDPS